MGPRLRPRCRHGSALRGPQGCRAGEASPRPRGEIGPPAMPSSSPGGGCLRSITPGRDPARDGHQGPHRRCLFNPCPERSAQRLDHGHAAVIAHVDDLSTRTKVPNSLDRNHAGRSPISESAGSRLLHRGLLCNDQAAGLSLPRWFDSQLEHRHSRRLTEHLFGGRNPLGKECITRRSSLGQRLPRPSHSRWPAARLGIDGTAAGFQRGLGRAPYRSQR
jgi:hypothetical protein